MTNETTLKIGEACDKHGAKAVYDAAYARMAGDRAALPRVGLPDVATIDMADEIGRAVFALLEPEERAVDMADAVITMARIP